MDLKFESVDFNSQKPLYLQVTEIIERKIKNKELAVGQKLPPQKELHKIFGVSKDTIGEAISNLVREGYVSSRRTHGTVIISPGPKKESILERKKEISFVVCNPQKDVLFESVYFNPNFISLVNGIEKKVKELNMFLMYTNMREPELYIKEREKEIAGMIIGGHVTPEFFRLIENTKIPFVLIGDLQQKKKTEKNIDIIAQDDFNGAYIATKHLIDLGHKRIIYIYDGQEDVFWPKELMRGYKHAHEEANIAVDEDLQIDTKVSRFEVGYEKMKEFMAKEIKFAAILGASPLICFGAIKAIKEKGMNVPEDISVVCIGDTHELTMVKYEYEEVGRTAVERLIERVTNPEWSPKRIIVPHKLFVRDSTRSIK